MNSIPHPAPLRADASPGRRALWTGRALGGLVALFLGFDAVMKLLASPEALAGTEALGYPARVVQPLGVVQLACLALLLIPRTAPLGAILWTGYLVGAVATHVRIGAPLFTHTLFPVYVAALLWASLWLRSTRVRNMFEGTGT